MKSSQSADMQTYQSPYKLLRNRICGCENSYLKSLLEDFCSFEIMELDGGMKELHIIPNKFTDSPYHPQTYTYICIPFVNKSDLTEKYLQRMAQHLYDKLIQVDKPIYEDKEAEMIRYSGVWSRTGDSGAVFLKAENTEFPNGEASPTVAIFPYDEPDHMAMYIGDSCGLSRAEWLCALSERLMEQKRELLSVLNMIRIGSS